MRNNHLRYSYSAISAIDIAIWDIKGKRLNAPIWDLLGGKVRNKVRAIAQGVKKTPEEFAEKVNFKEKGFAVKFTPMPSDWPKYTYSKLMVVSTNIVKAVRNKVGAF